MLKPPMPNAAGMTDTLEFVKNLWGGMNVPGASVPGMNGSSLSTDELDKKIADLKAVESWLNLNLGMLRGTIQALEVQRGTLATLKAMGDSMAQAMQRAGSDPALAQPFAQFFAQSAGAPSSAPSSPSSPPSPAPAASQADASAPPGPGATADQAGAAMPAAVAWWNMLQDQFRQAVASAMPPAGGGASGSADGVSAPAPAEPKARGGSPLDVSGGAPEAAPQAPPAHGARVGKNPRTKADKA
ncbi:MAG: PhaM family polyhydroxyalkanoate granule multifunctional regulatory protein [Janthinobacterium lividum]